MDAETDKVVRPILLVDDSAAHRRLIRRALGKAGLPHPIIEANSLEQALGKVRVDPPLVVCAAIVDLNLGDGRGSMLVHAMRALEGYKAIPIVVLSTSTLPADIRESYDRGADCYLVKSDEAMEAGVARCIRFMLRWE